jgi:hypothetical protein
MQNSRQCLGVGYNGLYFPKNHHTPNPAALSVCREYGKLRCGVTGRVSGRQMSCGLEARCSIFVPWYSFDIRTFWEWCNCPLGGTWTRHTLRPEVMADPEKVERVGIKYIE